MKNNVQLSPADKMIKHSNNAAVPRVKLLRNHFDDRAIKNKGSTYRPSTHHDYNLRNRKSSRQPIFAAQHTTTNATNFKSMAENLLHQQLHYDQFLGRIYDVNGRRQSIDKLLKGSDAPTKWSPALSNEWGRLAQGNDNGVECTNTINL